MAKAKVRKPRERTKRPKKGFLPGMEPVTNKVVDAAADHYYDVMMDRVKLSKEENEAKDNLIDKMKEAGLERYETSDGFIVTLVSASNVKVKKKKEEAAQDDGDGQAGSNGDGEE